jgi:hypothetical protein
VAELSEEDYRVYPHYNAQVQKKGRERMGAYLSKLKNPELGACVGLEESTVMMFERMWAKASQHMSGRLYRRMAVVEWVPARTVISLKMLLSTPREEYDAKGITREQLYNRTLAEISEMIDQVGRTAFLLSPEEVYSTDYLRTRIIPEVIYALKSPKPMPHLNEDQVRNVITRPSISPINLFVDLLGSPYYAYPAGKVGPLRAVTLMEIAMVPGILQDFVVEKIQILRGFGEEYKRSIFDRTMETHGPLGSGYVLENYGKLIRSIDVGLVRTADVTALTRRSLVQLSDPTLNALEYIIKLGLVPVEVIWYIFGEKVVSDIEKAINADIRFIVQRLGPVYITRRRITILNLKESDPLLLIVFSNLIEIWRRVLPWLWGDKEKMELVIKKPRNKIVMDFLEKIAAETFKITEVLKELCTKGTYTAKEPIERAILSYLRDKGLVITPPVASSDYFEVNMTQREYLEYMAKISGAIL